MNRRRTLNGQSPRMVREIDLDRYDWGDPAVVSHMLARHSHYVSNRLRHRIGRFLRAFVRWIAGPRP